MVKKSSATGMREEKEQKILLTDGGIIGSLMLLWRMISEAGENGSQPAGTGGALGIVNKKTEGAGEGGGLSTCTFSSLSTLSQRKHLFSSFQTPPTCLTPKAAFLFRWPMRKDPGIQRLEK